MSSSRAWPFRYEILDGLRGLAALTVVLHHLQIVTVGAYAVMVFFVISGYCVAAAAESCRRKQMSFGTFMRRRLHRIYPPYFFAIVFFCLTRLVKAATTGDHHELNRPWLDWLQNLTLTQWLSLPFHPVADAPQNPKLLVAAFWSLNYEEQFYLVMGIALLLSVRRGLPIAVTVIVLTAAGLFWNYANPGGWITGFFIEYWAHFSLGALLFLVMCVYPHAAARRAFVVAVAGLGVFCVWHIVPWQADTPLRQRAFVELAVASGFTLFLFFVRPASAYVTRLTLWRPIAALGVISYSLYLVHQFNLTLAHTIATRLAPGAWEPVRDVILVGLEITIAVVFWYFCERPFLNRTPQREAQATAAANLPVTPSA
jgi:peptidoglycan/LPS O-acetylase OafA/YrhL